MRSAVALLSMVAAIVAEAPYHLPRPAAHAPSFNYPTAPAPPPPPPSPHPHPYPHAHLHPHPHLQPQFIQYPPQPAPAPQFIQGPGYHYQHPNIAPAFVQPISQPQHPIPITSYPQPQYTQPLPQPIPQGPSAYNYPQPRPQIAPAPRPQPPPVQSQLAPLPAYLAPHPQPAPLPAYIAPQPQPAPGAQPTLHYQPQVTSQQGYSYQQPQEQYNSQLQLQPQPLQAQPLTNNAASSALSSYQADSNQYSSGSVQSHGEALDATVVDRVQNIIKDSEHTSARDAGYLSLVSGVSLEQARPSIEISSFVQNSPLQTIQNTENSSIGQSSSASAAAPAPAPAPLQAYGLPTITANNHPPLPDASPAFLPQNKPAIGYGAPQ